MKQFKDGNHLARKSIRTTQYGTESAKWGFLLGEIKNTSSLSVFRNKIRKWISENIHARLNRHHNVGYIRFLFDIC